MPKMSASKLRTSENQGRESRGQDPATNRTPQSNNERAAILRRDWVHTPQSRSGEPDRVKLMTWNMLAQCLVRRDLFPTSDCLKASQREGMLVGEILTYYPDIICLQEVDRLEKLLPPLRSASYLELYAAGRGKRHGCMILYREDLFEATGHAVIEYDDLDVRQTGDECERRGSSRLTRNIGLIVGLRRRNQPDRGYIVATTHLFWHPSFTYERIRQVGLLLRETVNFQKEHALQNWPCLIAGDFNFAPSDPAYSFMVGMPLAAQQSMDINTSRVVHSSIDPSVISNSATPKDDDEGGQDRDDPDRVITNARPARARDGLLSDAELHSFFDVHGPLRSLYDEGQRFATSEHGNVIGVRSDNIAPRQKGFYEPMWTSFTHYWKTTLDYIFILEPLGLQSHVLGFLKTHRTADLGIGLPLKGVCASDHVSLVVEIGTAERSGTD